jgi:dephospho-CoA kinase
MAALVFADDAARRRLEGILHPRIRALWLEQAERWRDEQRFAGVVVIPLLFETGVMERFDEIICVACSASSQRQRLIARGWDEVQIQQRLAAQWPVEKKLDGADFVIWTESKLSTHVEQISCVLQSLRARGSDGV